MGIDWETLALFVSVAVCVVSILRLAVLQWRVVKVFMDHHKRQGGRMGLFQASQFDLDVLPPRLRRRLVWAWLICLVCFCVMFGMIILVQPDAFAGP